MSQTEIKDNKQPPLSRLGRKPVEILDGVTVSIDGQTVSVEGKKGKLSWVVPSLIEPKVDGKQVIVLPKKTGSESKALHGLSRKLIFNMVQGVTAGFEKRLSIEGVGYRAQVAGDKLTMTLGFSHPVLFPIPKGVTLKVEGKGQNILIIEGCDKQQVGQVAAQIRDVRPPEPYKGTGIRYSDEVIKRKAGKAAVGSTGGKK